MSSRTDHALSRALGTLLSHHENPRVAVVPHDLPWAEVASLVQAANGARPDVAGGYSHLVLDSEPPVAVPRISSAQATAYREGPRLLVVRGHALGHASNEVFRPLLDASWPDAAHETVTLRQVARELVEVIHQGSGGDVLEAHIVQALEVSRALHLELGSGGMQWNTAWWLHVSVAVRVLAERVQKVPPQAMPEEVFPRAVRAAFGLPFVQGAGGKVAETAGVLVASGLSGPWGSADDASGSAKLLVAARADLAADWEGASFDGLDDKFHGNDSRALAWAKFLAESPTLADAVAQVPEKLFAAPAGTSQHELVLLDERGVDLGWSKGVNAARTEIVNGILQSEEIVLVLPVVGALRAPTGSGVMATVSPTRFTFSGSAGLEDGAIVLRGRFAMSGGAAAAQNFRPRVVRLALNVPPGDVLEGVVAPKATASVLLTHPTLPTFAIRADARGPVTAEVLDGEELGLDVQLTGQKLNDVLLANVGAAEPPTFDDEDWPASATLPWRYELQTGTQGFRVEMGDRFVDAQRKQDARSARWSPLIALLDDAETYSEGEPKLSAHEVRGVIEQDLAELLVSGLWRQGLGHYVLSEKPDSPPGLAQAPVPWARTENGLDSPQGWAGLIAPPVSDELLQSPEAEAFRTAFEALKLPTRARGHGRVGAPWPSLINYESLWNSQPLVDYLETYAALQERARSQSSGMDAFWAAYPFTVSVWKPGAPRAVLLSPWHPIRLAWLSAVSNGVEAEGNWGLRRRFAGVIEGWNFPAAGPAETPGAAMLAVPAGNGHEQLFVGWATMVRASSDLNVLQMPQWAGGTRAPVTTMSGLNGSAVRKALRDFQRANAHVSTLSIDLTMASDGPRLDEIDNAILDEVSQWLKDGRGQLAGLRIHDSKRRGGSVPVEGVQRLAASGIAITWQRYEDNGIQPDANIRVVQDAGQMVRTEQAPPGAASGAIAAIPYRRIETPGPVDPHNPALVESRLLLAGKPRGPFEAALQAIETPTGSSGLVVKSAFPSAMGSSASDWTVMGDSSLNPAAMARMVGQSPSELALWEWCPPMLGTGIGETVLESRPYLSVARMPTSLRYQLDGLLADWHEDIRVHPKDVLGTLGARGVGLASLIAIGGSHASGAMGFYVALRLLEQLSTASDLHLVLPMDACAEYLTALAMNDKAQDDSRRADLLLVRITPSEVVLSPVEIKYYKPGPLPHATHGDLRDGLGQLGNSMAQLQRLEEAAEGQDGPSLWNAAFGALLEVGVRLSASTDGAPEEAADLLRRASSGELSVRVGRPVLCFFKRSSNAARIERLRLDGFEHLQVVADPSLAMGWLESSVDRSVLVDGLIWATHPGQERVPEYGEGTLSAAATGVTAVPDPEVNPLHIVDGSDSEAGPVDVAPAAPADVYFGRSLEVEMAPHDEAVGAEARTEEPPETSAGQASTQEDVSFPGVRFGVGTLTDSVGTAEAEFWPANTALTQLNVGVVGNLGTGKTQLLKTLVTQLRRVSAERQPSPVSVLILDYKGDFTGPDFLEAVGGRVLKPHDIPVNYFDLDGPYSPMAAVRRAGSFNDVLGQIFNIGPKQQNALRKVVVERFKRHGVAPTIAEVLEDYAENHSDSDSVVGVLEGWVMGEVFSDDRSQIRKFSELMADGVVVLDLLELGADQASKNALVALFLNLYYEYVVKLEKWPYQGQKPQLRRLNSFLLVDEATNIMSYKFDALESLLLQGREFGAGVILSSQYLSHFKSSHIDYSQALRSWFVHSVPNVTSTQLAMLGLQGTDPAVAAKITALPTHHCLYSSLDYSGRFMRGTPFYELRMTSSIR